MRKGERHMIERLEDTEEGRGRGLYMSKRNKCGWKMRKKDTTERLEVMEKEMKEESGTSQG